MVKPEIKIDSLGGCMPVQAEGTINGEEFYFRARREWWTVEIGPEEALIWEYTERYPGAGDMSKEEAMRVIEEAACRFLASKPPRAPS